MTKLFDTFELPSSIDFYATLERCRRAIDNLSPEQKERLDRAVKEYMRELKLGEYKEVEMG